MELGTERVNGMGMGSIPISKIWLYMERHNLPEWWEPIILQADAVIVASHHKELDGGKGTKSGGSPKDLKRDTVVHSIGKG
jgi:hypothetical protein